MFYPIKNIETKFAFILEGSEDEFLKKINRRIWEKGFKTFDGKIFKSGFEITTPQPLWFGRRGQVNLDISGSFFSWEEKNYFKLKISVKKGDWVGAKISFFALAIIVPLILTIVCVLGKLLFIQFIAALFFLGVFLAIVTVLINSNINNEIYRMAKLLESISKPSNY